MLKKIFVIGAIVALTGCATHQQSNELAGAAVGGIIGHAVGGNAGAVIGAGVGAMVGNQQPTQPQTRIIRERQPIYVEPHYDHRSSCQIYVERESACYRLRYLDTRAMCIEDAREHFHQCMRRR